MMRNTHQLVCQHFVDLDNCVVFFFYIYFYLCYYNCRAGLPDEVNEEEYQHVCEAASKLGPQPVTFLTALLCSEEDVRPTSVHAYTHIQ